MIIKTIIALLICLIFRASGLEMVNISTVIQNEKSETKLDLTDENSVEQDLAETYSIDEQIFEQLQTFYNTKSQWELIDGVYDNGGELVKFDDGYGYAITDIDKDDKLEILVSGMAGSGQYSINNFYEYNGKDKIQKLRTAKLSINNSEPDLINHNYFSGCEKYDDEYHYLFKDYQGYGASGGRMNYYDVVI